VVDELDNLIVAAQALKAALENDEPEHVIDKLDKALVEALADYMLYRQD
jgi:hypothetical protein